MALVGDVIVSAREAFPDPASFLAPPSSDGAVGSGSGGTLPAATYYFIVTALNQWGETTGTIEGSYVASGSTSKIVFTPILPVGVMSFRVYIAASAGGEQGYFASSGTSPLTVTTLTGLIAGAVPTRTSAMLPDTDGGAVSVYTIYRWLNDALTKAGRIGGGLPTVAGIQGQAGVAMYRITGRWIRFTNYWFDGWPMSASKRSDAFLHNPITAIPGLVSVEEFSDTTVLQLWPQPNRTGSTTTTTGANMGVTDTSVGVTLSSNFIAPGICQIDNEIMAFSSISGNILGGLMRGIGGTVAATHTSGATVTELNIRVAGFKQPPQYSVGQSATSIPIISGWEVPLEDYLLAQFRRAEQNTQEAMAIEKQFTDDIESLVRKFRGKTNPTQIGSFTRESYGGSISGGLLIP